MKNVTAAVIVKDGRVLLTRRAPEEKLAGYWEFPGGKQEPDESVQECLARELEEELVIHCAIGDVFDSVEYHYEGGAINLIALHAEIVSGSIMLTVHDKYEWVSAEDLLSYKLAPADVPIARNLKNHLLGH